MVILKDFYEYILHIEAEEANGLVKEYIDKLFVANFDEQRKIIGLFIKLLSYPKLYDNFGFGEIVQFFLCDYNNYTQNEKELFIKYICKNLQYITKSKDENLPYFLHRFIEKHIDKNLVKKYCNFDLDNFDSIQRKYINLLLIGKTSKISSNFNKKDTP